jgi:hypothetical protein
MPSYNLYRRTPLEVRLELCGFLSLAEWTRLAEHNRKTRRMLVGNQRYLAPIPRLYYVRFVCIFVFSFYLLILRT